MELFFEQVRATAGIAEIFCGIAAGVYLQADGAPLEGCMNVGNALAVRVIESFGDTEDGSEAARHALIQIGQRGIRNVMAGRLRFAVVITHQGSDDGTVAPFQARNVTIQRQIFAVLVMPVMADGVADVVKQRGGLK